LAIDDYEDSTGVFKLPVSIIILRYLIIELPHQTPADERSMSVADEGH
jgi:hypothetical protein